MGEWGQRQSDSASNLLKKQRSGNGEEGSYATTTPGAVKQALPAT